jgi:hypothetical protein
MKFRRRVEAVVKKFDDVRRPSGSTVHCRAARGRRQPMQAASNASALGSHAARNLGGADALEG